MWAIILNILPLLLSGLGFLICKGAINPNADVYLGFTTASPGEATTIITASLFVVGWLIDKFAPKFKPWFENIANWFTSKSSASKKDIALNEVFGHINKIQTYGIAKHCTKTIDLTTQLNKLCATNAMDNGDEDETA